MYSLWYFSEAVRPDGFAPFTLTCTVKCSTGAGVSSRVRTFDVHQVDLQPPAADALAAPEASADDLSPWFHELGLRDPAKSHPLAEEALSDEDSGLPDQLDVPVHAAEVHAIPQVAESPGMACWKL